MIFNEEVPDTNTWQRRNMSFNLNYVAWENSLKLT